ncbi:MAG: 3' terminal RNA ribose 2'-O-methyltransferase Hen1 [Candidatus Sericytochromatia bacterium]
MLLSITCEDKNCQELSWILHKRPDKIQSFPIISGNAYVFYPEYSDNKVKVCLALDIDTINLVRKLRLPVASYALQHYVNDKPYTASSFMSSAIANVFSSALNGICKEKPEIVDLILPLEVEISVLKVLGGEALIKRLFEPLGYQIEVESFNLDEDFKNWGKSRYYKIKLKNNITIKELLSHLYVLIPVFDMDKHFYIGTTEVESFLKKGDKWLQIHPEKGAIVRRYFKNLGKYSNLVLNRLNDSLENTYQEMEIPKEIKEKKESLQKIRLNTVLEKLENLYTTSVVDIGCGEGMLLKLLKSKKRFEKICGTDVMYQNLLIAKDKLDLEETTTHRADRIKLFQSSILYKDERLKEYETVCLIEVIEHIEEDRLDSLEEILFGYLNPKYAIISTPNAEYNAVYMPENPTNFRHDDHRFEWNRDQFRQWVNKICEKFSYSAEFFDIGDVHEKLGTPTQAVIFKRV